MNSKRVATMQLDNQKTPSLLKVSVPRDVNAKELAGLNAAIIENVIKGHTGCSCLSGQISVLLESDFEKVMQVNLGTHQLEPAV